MIQSLQRNKMIPSGLIPKGSFSYRKNTDHQGDGMYNAKFAAEREYCYETVRTIRCRVAKRTPPTALPSVMIRTERIARPDQRPAIQK